MATAVVVTSDSALTAHLSSLLEGVAMVAASPPTLDAVELAVQELDPRVLFIDVERRNPADRPLGELVAAVRRFKPDQYVIAVGDALAPQTILAAIRAGANDYIDAHCGADELRERSFRQIKANPPHAAKQPGSVVMILSGRPNDGESFVAMHLAATRARQRGERADAVLIDFNLPVSECETAFNVALNYTIADALDDLPRLDRTLLTSALPRDRTTGLYFLPLAATAKPLSLPSAEALASLIDTLSAAFGEIIINLGCLRHSDTLTKILPLASQLVVVATQSLSSIRCCSDVLRQVRACRLTPARDVLALYDFHRTVEPGVERIARVLEIPWTVPLPSDPALLLNALNEGILPVAAHPGSPYVRAIEALAHAVYETPAAAAPAEGRRLSRLLGGLRCLVP